MATLEERLLRTIKRILLEYHSDATPENIDREAQRLSREMSIDPEIAEVFLSKCDHGGTN